MTREASFQTWMDELACGRESAVRALWEEYFEKVVRLARRKLKDIPCRDVDEEDVALSAINSLVFGVERGRFPHLADPDDLWRILFVITARKANAHRKRHMTQKRGGGRTRGGSAFLQGEDGNRDGIGQVLGQTPTADFQAMMTEECEHRLGALSDARLRVAALCKLEGYTNEEIADVFGTTTRTVERWLRQIRQQWEPER